MWSPNTSLSRIHMGHGGDGMINTKIIFGCVSDWPKEDTNWSKETTMTTLIWNNGLGGYTHINQQGIWLTIGCKHKGNNKIKNNHQVMDTTNTMNARIKSF